MNSAARVADTVTAVVCAYTERRWDDLLLALQSIDSQSTLPTERMVVVDHNEALLDRLRLAKPDWTVVPNCHQRGLSGARNTALDHATSKWLVFLDDDAEADPSWLSELLGAASRHKAAGAGGLVVPRWASAPQWLPEEFYWVVGCSYRGLPVDVGVVRNPIGASMLVDRDSLERIGGFSTNLGRTGNNQAGCEETEMAIRVTAASGAPFVHVPASVVRHHVTSERLRLGYFARRCWAEGRSKRRVTVLAGSSMALQSERAFALRLLRKGVFEHARAAAHGDLAALVRIAVIPIGMGIVTVGFAYEALRERLWPGPKLSNTLTHTGRLGA